MKRGSIKSRLIIWLSIMGAIPLVLIILFTYSYSIKELRQDKLNSLETIRDLKVEELNNWFDERIADVNVMAGDYEVRSLENIIGKSSLNPEEMILRGDVQKLLERYHENYRDYKEIFIIDRQTGIIELSTNKDNIGKNRSERDYYKEPIRTEMPYIKDVHRSPSTGTTQMIFSQPIICMSHNSHIIGILVARIDLEATLYPMLLNRTGLGNTGETLIINSNGQAINNLRWYENAPLNLNIDAKPANEAVKGNTGIVEAPDYRGVKVLAAYTHIPLMNWGFVAKQDSKEVFASVNKLTKVLFIFTGIVILLIFSIALIIGRSITKPISEIRNLSVEMSGGNLGIRHKSQKRYEEINSLGISLNNLAQKLQARINTQKIAAEITLSVVGKKNITELAASLSDTIMKLSNSQFIAVYRYDSENRQFYPFVSKGINREMLKEFDTENAEGEIGLAASSGKLQLIKNSADSGFVFRSTSGDIQPSEIISIPVIIGKTVTAVISAGTVSSYSYDFIDALERSITGINNSWQVQQLNEQREQLSENLKKSNEELEIKSEELQEQAEELHSQSEELQEQSEELQQQNEELETRAREVEEANRLKSEFLANMSHELRTPLNSVIALTKVLRDQARDKLDEDENSYLEVVERNGQNLLRLINEILDLSKIEAGKLELHPEKTSLESIFSSVIASMEHLASEKGLTLESHMQDNMPVVETDMDRLNQVITNIVNNAIKFTEKGKIKLIAKTANENAIIEVEDTGIGIDKESLNYIFDEFRQVDGSSSRHYEGAGLGLAIVNKLVLHLGGKIDVESQPGKGSVFTISLPLTWEKTHGNSTVIETEIESSEPDIDITGKEILIIEDNEAALIQIKGLLEKEGYKIKFARGGNEAIDMLNKDVPDAIIADLMMPETDGFSVIEYLRKNKKIKDIPVLVLTAKDLTRKDREFMKKNKVQHYIQKGDIDIVSLLMKVRSLFRQKSNNKYYDNNTHVKLDNDISPKRILIIEDNEDNLITVRAIVDKKYRVTEARDGKVGLEKAKEEKPDIILMDIALPEVDGIELIKEMKNDKDISGIPVIAVTARVMKGDREKILNAGFDEYVAKPVNGEELLKKIEENLIK